MARTIIVFIGLIFAGYSLGLFYSWFSFAIAQPLIYLLVFHSFISLTFLLTSAELRELLSFRRLTLSAFYPALLLIGAVGGAALLTGTLHQEHRYMPDITKQFLLTVVCVPVVEEILYRGALIRLLQSICTQTWMILYGSALVFALAHTAPSMSPFALPAPPLGVFLLGGSCAYLRWRSKSLWPAIFLHLAGNLTVYLFQYLDPRWLDWLSFLYLRS